jgi:hypothetical protein
VNVDSVGIGYYMVQHLKDQDLPVRGVNVGERSNRSEKYSNLKAELYWGLRQRALEGDLAGLADERTIAQLAGIRYSHNSRGQIVIESKEDARKRGVKSPDRAEAVMLAFAERKAEFGYLEYLKQMQAELDVRGGSDLQPAIRAPSSASAAGHARCPTCEKETVVRIGGGFWRCNHCGWQPKQKPPELGIPNRYELLRGIR